MKLIKIITIGIYILLSLQTAFPGVFEPDKLKVYMMMDKRYFYSDEKIILKICVKNISSSNNFFHIFDDMNNESGIYTTFQPVIFDMNGREAEIKVPYRIESKKMQDLLQGLQRRMVELAPGESIVHTVDLNELYYLKRNTPYRIASLFYPDFTMNKVLKSDNELHFRIVKARRYEKRSKIDSIERAVSPGEIILLALNAEKQEDWRNLIKYINVSKLINSYPNFVKKYYFADYEKKEIIKKDFIKFLTRKRHDYILDFSVIKEEFENKESVAYVDVIMDRYGIKKTDRYKYRYTLEKYKNLWLITDIEASVLKGVKR